MPFPSRLQEEQLRAHERERCIRALNDAERVGEPHVEHLFTDVYDAPTWMLRDQRARLKAHPRKYAESYPDISPERTETL